MPGNILIAISLLMLLVLGVAALLLSGRRQANRSEQRPDDDEN